MQIFPSKVDISYYAVLCMYGVMTISFCLISKSIGSSIFVAALFILIFNQIRSIKYKIDGKSKRLIISGGLFYSTTLDITSILTIIKDKSTAAAPAGSYDGIRINTKTKAVKISPINQDEFLEVLKKLNPKIEINI